MRVVSLVPSATEILCRIGGEGLLVGRSHQCDWPPTISNLPAVTRPHSATLDADALKDLRPDVILTQDLASVCAIADTLNPRPQVVCLKPVSFFEVLDDTLKVGDAVGLAREAERAMVELREGWWSAIDFVNPYGNGDEVLFLEWMDPVFVGGHWTPQLIDAAGGRHSLNAVGAKSRVAMPEEIIMAAPGRVIICPCGVGLPKIREDLAALRRQPWWPLIPAVMDGPGRVALVDGSAMFNRPGPRLVDAFRWLVAWLNDRPEVSPPGFPVEYL